jgi:hypothetical protein
MSLKEFEKFKKYHAENPHIYEAFKEKALEAAKRKVKFSARAICAVIRWETPIEGTGNYKINDHASPYYARMFEKEYPQYKGFFDKLKILPEEFES